VFRVSGSGLQFSDSRKVHSHGGFNRLLLTQQKTPNNHILFQTYTLDPRPYTLDPAR